MAIRAYGKINLILNVLAKRQDNYHDLEMVMVPLLLHDLLTIRLASSYSFKTNVKYLKEQNNNIIYQVIQEMRKRYGFSEEFAIELTKYIPTQAGLGGGSSDGAAAIILLDGILGLKLSQQEREDIANCVGKDVAFCLYNRPALVSGMGEKLAFIDNNLDLKMLLVKPGKGISTKIAYEKLHEYPRQHYDTGKMIRALANGDYQGVVDNLGNAFEEVAQALVPDIAQLKKQLKDFGFDGSLLCGSGSCVLALSQNDELLSAGLKHFRKSYPFVWQTAVKRRQDD